jgi:hypothetical protein
VAGGRPKLFKSDEELQAAVNEYFEGLKTPDGDPEPPTMAGLADHLGMTRQTLVNYGKDDEFFYTVRGARAKVETFLERRLYEASPTGAIFNLKNNFGWKDQQDHRVGGADGGPISLSFNGVSGNAPG